MANHLSYRSALWGAAVLVSIGLTSNGAFAIGPDNAAKAGECLKGPKGAAPAGERWFYRVERGTKRHCWYTRADTSRNVAARTQAPEPASTIDEPAPEPLQPSVANARAEVFPAPDAIKTPPAAPTTTLPDAQPRTLTDRFSDHPNADQPVQTLPAGVLPTPRVAAQPSADDQGTSWWVLLMMIGGGTLTLAAAAAALIAHFRPQERLDDQEREARWDDQEARAAYETQTSPPLSMSSDEPNAKWDGPPINWVRIAREHAEKNGDDIEHLLGRPTRPA